MVAAHGQRPPLGQPRQQPPMPKWLRLPNILSLRPCLYRKLDSAIMMMKSAEDRHSCDAAYVLDGAMDRLCQEPDESSTHYNKRHTLSESGVSALRPRRQYGRHTRGGLIRSIFRRSRSAKARPGRWACHGCPWLAIGARPERRR